MDGHSIQPLTPTEAKERLRLAASRVGLHAWAKSSPWSLLVLALGGGYLAGRVPVARTALVWSLAQLATELVKPVSRANNQLLKHR